MLAILNSSGFEVGDAAKAIVAAPSDHMSYDNRGGIWMNWLNNTMIVTPGDDGLPVISTMVQIGRGLFEDRVLEIPDILPEVIMTAASGRQLGEIIATGVHQLDIRRIQAIIRYDKEGQRGGWHPDSNTEILLEPDLVSLGDHTNVWP